MNARFSVRSSFLLLSLIVCASAQHLPDLPTKPAPKFEKPSFCPPEGAVGGMADPELNRQKNRIDAAIFFPVDFNDVKTLAFPATVGGKLRKDWTPAERTAVEKFEGIPITVQGFLALVNNALPGKPPLIQGARPEGKESCNCGSTKPNQIDFHIWLLSSAGASRKNAIVVEMTPRVRAHHPDWTVANLTKLAQNKVPVRISGWLMMDGQHPEQLGKTRATLWEIHPIIEFQFKQGSTFKTL